MTQQPGWNDPQTQPYGQAGAPMGQPQQYGQVQPYQAPAYQTPMVMQPMPTFQVKAANNTMATCSLIFALVGLIFFPILAQILALIFGIVAKGQIKRTGEGGAGMATAGIIISSIILGLAVIGTIFWIVVVVILGAAGVAAS
ncbi:MAG: DUF4190 domain-containing protein [Streptosporangiales bacterium]|nr:DUF4190 domain-containing protein [Streptosporangiales bacterium]